MQVYLRVTCAWARGFACRSVGMFFGLWNYELRRFLLYSLFSTHPTKSNQKPTEWSMFDYVRIEKNGASISCCGFDCRTNKTKSNKIEMNPIRFCSDCNSHRRTRRSNHNVPFLSGLLYVEAEQNGIVQMYTSLMLFTPYFFITSFITFIHVF